jgi:ATP-dependent Lhr-like helicase
LAVDAELARATGERPVRGPEDLADLLRALGPQSAEQLTRLPWTGGPAEEPEEPSPVMEWARELVRAKRVIEVRLAGTKHWASVEDAGMLRDGLGIALPPGIPIEFTNPVADPLGSLIRRYARTHGPFSASQLASAFGLGIVVASRELDRMTSAGQLTSGRLRPEAAGGSGELDYCDPEVLTRLRRRSLAVLRRQVEPVEQHVLASFAGRWHQLGALYGTEGVLQAVAQLAGAAVPASAIESLILPNRVKDYAPAMLDELITAGEIAWVGAGRAGGSRAVDGSIRLLVSDTDDALLAQVEPVEGAMAGALLEILRDGGGFLAADLRERLAARGVMADDPTELRDALWQLAWAGWVTADSFAPVRATLSGGKTAHHTQRRKIARPLIGRRVLRPGMPITPTGRRAGPTDPRTSGRWLTSPIPAVQGLEVTIEQLRAAQVGALMERHGVLTKGAAAIETSFASVYPVLAALEESGAVRRGYFIERLGGSQFALPQCPDLLRSASNADDAVLLAAADPANPYGAALPWPQHPSAHRPGRTAGALVVIIAGQLVLYVERGGHTAMSFGDPRHLSRAAETLAASVHGAKIDSLKITRVDGVDALAAHADLHPLAEALLTAGFTLTPSGLRLRRTR